MGQQTEQAPLLGEVGDDRELGQAPLVDDQAPESIFARDVISTKRVPESRRGKAASSTMNLANTIVGAGLMALPKVVEQLGVVVGVASIVFVWACSSVTLGYIIQESERTGHNEIGAVYKARCGATSAAANEVAIMVNNLGLLIIYLRILGDVLVGSADFQGIITEFASRGWYCNREAVVGALAAALLLPMCCLRSLDSLSAVSGASFGLAVVFSVVVVVLAGVEIHHSGGVKGIFWLPNPDYFDGGPIKALGSVLGVFPVIFTAYVCHYNLLHVKAELPRAMHDQLPRITARACAFCTLVYSAVAFFGYVLFKGGVQDDVLLNFNCKVLAPLLGKQACVAVSVFVRSIYGMTLMMTFPLIHFPLRETILGAVCFGERQPGALLRCACAFMNISVAFVVASAVPNIWTPLQVSGAVAAGVIGFVLPSLLHLSSPSATRQSRPAAWALLAVGLLVGADTVWMLLAGKM